MAQLADYIKQLQTLTKRNLEILSSINESFFTKNNHTTVDVGGSMFTIPSFLALENKLNTLQENFNNIVKSPQAGGAYVSESGNTREIIIKGYNNTPVPVALKPIDEYSTEQNNIFKDFLSPLPYVKFDVSSLPDDITQVLYRKVVPLNSELVAYFKGLLGEKPSVDIDYATIQKRLQTYKPDIDYILYDVVKRLPIKSGTGNGIYIINEVLDDSVDDNLDNYITVSIRGDYEKANYRSSLTYLTSDECIARNLKEGDILTTFDDTCKLEINELNRAAGTMRLKVLSGSYVSLHGTNKLPKDTDWTKVSSYSKLRYWGPANFDESKYVSVPLEEDQYVFIAVAPFCDKLNTRSSWGTGLALNTFSLIDKTTNQAFMDYYKENVHNIGDILYEITSVLSSTVNSLSKEEYEGLKTFKPELSLENLPVVQINSHLNDSESVKNIRTLYSQKQQYNTQLNELRESIENINNKLASVSFDDVSGVRSTYVSQLNELNSNKNNIINSLAKIVNEISLAANNSDIPIENAKYHIRGFFDYADLAVRDHISGINVQYRYKNVDSPQGRAHSIGDKFLFSDWNEMLSIDRHRESYIENGRIKFRLTPDNSTSNEPSFNQIDIPISQGEKVDIRLQVVYDYGYPLSYTTSDWSDIITVDFPDEFIKDVQILDIINENNSDIETNRFNNILSEKGIPQHMDDKVVDQDIVYFHKPENISSGFYTAERRIIPLREKLAELDASVKGIRDEILGAAADILDVSIVNGDVVNKLYPFQNNNIGVEAYNSFEGDEYDTGGLYNLDKKTGIVSTIMNIVISNSSEHVAKIYSLFPGSRSMPIGNLVNSIYNKEHYSVPGNTDKGIYIVYDNISGNTHKEEALIQVANQFVTFRLNNPFDGTKYYGDGPDQNPLTNPLDKIDTLQGGSLLYPRVREKSSLCVPDDNVQSNIILNPGQEIVIPVVFRYKLDQSTKTSQKTISFDIRTSLYKDPQNYTFTINAKYENSMQDKLISSNRRIGKGNKYHTVVK